MEKRLEGPGAAPRIVEVMYFKGIPKQVSQQPNMGLPQQWEAQWQEFLRMIQPAHLVQGNPQPTDAVPWDDAKAFLDAFEQVAEACRWPREEWVGRLVPALRGGVEQYICQLDPQDRLDYLKVKAAILRSDTFRRELKRQHFRHCSYQEREGPRRAYNQLQELCRQWLKPDRHTKEQILELIIQEQLLATLPSELQSWLRECGPENCIEMVALAEDFLMGHRQARMWDRQIAVPEMIAGSLEADRLPRQQHGGVACQGNREIGNEMTPTRNSSVGLPSGEQPTAEVGITTIRRESMAVKEELNLDPNPNPWEFTQGSSGGGSSASGHLIPPSEATDQPDREALFTPSPEPGESVSSTFLGDRLLSDIKTEDTEDSDMDNAYEPFPEDFPDASSLGPQVGQLPSGGLDGASPRQGQKALKKKGGKVYPREKRHVCSDCGHRAYYLSDLMRHMNKHSKEVYECLECGKTFKGLLAFENHQKTHDTSGDLSTAKKGQKSTTLSPQTQEDSKATPVGPAEHTEVPSEDKPYRCGECGKDFKWQSNLYRHQRLHKYQRIHPLRSRDVPEPQDTNSQTSKDCKEVLSLHPATYEPESISRLRPRKPEESGAPPLQRGIKTLRVVLTKLANTRSGKVHRCPDCGYKTNWLSVLVNHMRVHTKERPYTCKGCGKHFRYSSSLSKHQKYTCSESLLAEGDSLAEHLQTYGEDEALRRMTTSRQEKIGSEVSSSAPETETKGAPSKKIHPCSKCEYRAESFADLIKHLRIHIGEKPYQCHTCGKAFDSPSSFAKHLQTHKNASPNSTGPDAATPTVAECDVTLSDDEELINILAKKSAGKSGRAGGKVSKAKAHQKVAGRKRSNTESPTDAKEAKKSRYDKLERKHKCPDCPHRTYYLADLLKHQRIHTREKPYKCPDCGKSFTSKSAVTSHQKRCSRPDQKNPEEQNKKKGKRKYTCSRCGHKTYKLSTLLVHLRLHLSEKPFKCQECGEAFAQSSNLAEHMSVHTAAEDGGSQQTPPSNPPETATGNEVLPLMDVKEEELELEITPEGNYQTLSVTPKENSAITALSQRWRYSKDEKQKEPEGGFQLREPKTEEDEVPLDRLAVPIKEEPMEEPVMAVQPQKEVTEKPQDNLVRKEVSVRAMLEKFAYCKTRETSPEKPETSPAVQEEEKLPSKEVKLSSSKEVKLPSKEVKPSSSKEVTGRESRREESLPAGAKDTSVGSILCDQCGEGFLRDSELVRHQLTNHWE